MLLKEFLENAHCCRKPYQEYGWHHLPSPSLGSQTELKNENKLSTISLPLPSLPDSRSHVTSGLTPCSCAFPAMMDSTLPLWTKANFSLSCFYQTFCHSSKVSNKISIIQISTFKGENSFEFYTRNSYLVLVHFFMYYTYTKKLLLIWNSNLARCPIILFEKKMTTPNRNLLPNHTKLVSPNWNAGQVRFLSAWQSWSQIGSGSSVEKMLHPIACLWVLFWFRVDTGESFSLWAVLALDRWPWVVQESWASHKKHLSEVSASAPASRFLSWVPALASLSDGHVSHTRLPP